MAYILKLIQNNKKMINDIILNYIYYLYIIKTIYGLFLN